MNGSSTAPRPTLLHVCGRYLPLSETFTYDLIKGLGDFGHHVVASAIENLRHFPLDNVSVPEPEEGGWQLARAIDARAVVCHFGPQATMGMPAALYIDVPAVTIFHGYDISRLLRDRRWAERYRAVAALGMRALCISNAGRAKLLQIGWPESQIEVIHLGVDVARFQFKPPSQRWQHRRPRRILMVARLVEKKGVAIALDAMRRLRDAGVELELRIVGDGPERERLESLRAEWQLPNVLLLGALDHEDTRQEFASADLYIQPSITASSGDQEGIPVSLMEAQASGLPVVSTRHSGIPELVLDGHTGLLTDEGDSEGLALAAARLVNDPEEAEHFAHAGRHFVQVEFDRQTQTGRFASYFTSLVHADAARPSSHLARRPRPRRRGLVIHSIPTGLLARKLLLLTQRHPDVRWDILTSRGTAHEARDIPLTGDVHAYEDGRLSLRRVGIELLGRLQATQYDVVVIPYSDETGNELSHVRRIAPEFGARQATALTLRDTELSLPQRRRRLQVRRDDFQSALPRGA